MEKIIEVKTSEEGFKCLLCCQAAAKLKLTITRPAQKDTVTSFHVCDACLARMQREIQIIE